VVVARALGVRILCSARRLCVYNLRSANHQGAREGVSSWPRARGCGRKRRSRRRRRS